MIQTVLTCNGQCCRYADRDDKPCRPRGLNVEILWITQAPTPSNSQHSPQMIFVGFY